MADWQLTSVMTAISENENRSGDYYVYRKGNSFRIKSPSGYSYLCHSSVENEDAVKKEISTVFQAKVTKVTPGGLWGLL